MRLLILFNPVAGRGRARAAAGAMRDALVHRGHHVVLRETNRAEAASSGLDGGGDGPPPDGLIVVGGDGTMRLAAPLAMRLGVPVALFPFGTENLFARQHGMKRDVETIVSLVTGGRSRAVDVGVVNGEVFLMMVSIGLDASVVHDLAARRRGPISHASYIMPIARAMLNWRAPRLRVRVDGADLDLPGPGMLVVANTRQYAGRLDPASTAVDDDGLLDVVFFSVRSRWELLRRVTQCWRRRLLNARGVVHGRGRSIRVEAQLPQVFQVDGDPPAVVGGRPPTTPLEISVLPGALRVFRPACSARQ